MIYIFCHALSNSFSGVPTNKNPPPQSIFNGGRPNSWITVVPLFPTAAPVHPRGMCHIISQPVSLWSAAVSLSVPTLLAFWAMQHLATPFNRCTYVQSDPIHSRQSAPVLSVRSAACRKCRNTLTHRRVDELPRPRGWLTDLVSTRLSQ